MNGETSASFTLHPIGRIRTPHLRLEDCPRGVRSAQGSAQLEIDPVFHDALLDIDQASHLHVLYWLDRSERSVLRRPTPHDGVLRGVFATRSPVRPNPIGLAVVKFLRRKGGMLAVSGMDCLDGTALLDLKPYLPGVDCAADAVLTWFSGRVLDPTGALAGKESA
ncbi:MAG: tRNA (N6-threonylcarbamoyladenosine(37)-N6)-methyltransferase TrmO [Rhodocyclaceae bacterium]|nr:tRNA (N6-threonylcarbamoyladenosine(37)-N6)-methyltransferase TrmO [Rhodocyclaceae bacterium]